MDRPCPSVFPQRTSGWTEQLLPACERSGPNANGQLLFSSIGTGFADGFQFPILLKMLLDDPAVNHRQRSQLDSFTPAPDFLSRLARFAQDVVVLVVPVMLTVDGDTGRLEVVALQDPIDEKLQLAQRLAVFADEPAGIRRGDMQEGRPVQHRLFNAAGNAQAGENFFDDVFGIEWRSGLWSGIHLDLLASATGASWRCFRRLSHCWRMDRNCCSVQ